MSERIALLKSALKNKSKETVPSSSSSIDYGTLSASELEAQIRAAEAEEDLRRVRWQVSEAEVERARAAEAALVAAEQAAVQGAERLKAAAAAALALVLVLLVGVLAAAVLTLGGWRKPSGKLWGAAVLASLALYLLAIAWTLWSVVDGLLWPPR